MPREVDQVLHRLMVFHEIENLMPMKEPVDKIRKFRILLEGQAISYFEHHLMRRLEEEHSDVPDMGGQFTTKTEVFVNNEEHLLRALANTGASSSINILEAYNSAPFIKTENSNTTTWSSMGVKFTTAKTGICL
jgi:hypothetical protein